MKHNAGDRNTPYGRLDGGNLPGKRHPPARVTGRGRTSKEGGGCIFEEFTLFTVTNGVHRGSYCTPQYQTMFIESRAGQRGPSLPSPGLYKHHLLLLKSVN